MMDQDPNEREKSDRYICGFILLVYLVYKCKVKNKIFFSLFQEIIKKKK